MASTVCRDDGSATEVRISDISYDGCQLETDIPFAIGETVTLNLPQMGEVKAQIRWTSLDGRSGARFLIDEAEATEHRLRA
jgi:hypothetical protein